MSELNFGFIGLGLIGGSIAKALKITYPDCTIIAYDICEKTLALAFDENIVDLPLKEVNPSFSVCDYIFLCAPVSHNEDNLRKVGSLIKSSCILTDVGSVKTNIHEKIIELNLEANFIGGHPMTGSERTGFANGKASLLENAYYILTPSKLVSDDKIKSYSELVSSIKAIPLVLDYTEHDYITAAISHVPHILAYALVNLVQEKDNPAQIMKAIAAGGFKDITRIASSSPVMWQQICLNNKKNIETLLNSYISSLQEIKDKILFQQEDELLEYFETARSYRESFIDASLGPIKKVYSLQCDIPDRAGALANIATLLAEQNINIKNIGIVHNREIEEGVLRIEFYDGEAMDNANNLLKSKGYVTH